MEDLKYTQDFDEDALPDVFSLDYSEKYPNGKSHGFVVEGGYKSNDVFQTKMSCSLSLSGM